MCTSNHESRLLESKRYLERVKDFQYDNLTIILTRVVSISSIMYCRHHI